MTPEAIKKRDELYPGDLHFRPECNNDKWKCGAKLNWIEGFDACYKMRDEEFDGLMAIEFRNGAMSRNAEIARLEARLQTAIDALKFYANPESKKAIVSRISLPTGQVHNITSDYDEDAGHIAKEVLKALESEGESNG